MIFGYTTEEINDLNAEYVYVDNGIEKKNYQKLLSEIKPNDIVIIDSLLNLGDTLTAIIDEWNRITKELKAKIIVRDIKEFNDTVNDMAVSDLVMLVLDKLVQGTKEKAKQKQLNGIKQAKESGIKLGRPFSKLPNNTNQILDDYISKKITNEKAAKAIGVSRATFFRMAKARRLELAGEDNE